MASSPGKNTRNTKRRRKNRRLRRLVAVLLLLAVVILVIVLLVRLRGRVELSSGDVPPSGTTATTSVSATGEGTAAVPSGTDTTAGTTATAGRPLSRPPAAASARAIPMYSGRGGVESGAGQRLECGAGFL